MRSSTKISRRIPGKARVARGARLQSDLRVAAFAGRALRQPAGPALFVCLPQGRRMTIWVTGANGFIGRYLARELADAGHAVHGIGHGAIGGSREAAARPADMVERRDRRGQSECAGCRARIAVDRSFIWPADRRLDYRSRCRLRIFRVLSRVRRDCWSGCAAPRRKRRLIVASSAAVYGADHAGPIAENAALLRCRPTASTS